MACGLGSGSVSLGRQHLSRPCSRGATWARSRAVHRRAALFGTLFIMLTCTLSSANTTLCRRRSRVVTPDIHSWAASSGASRLFSPLRLGISFTVSLSGALHTPVEVLVFTASGRARRISTFALRCLPANVRSGPPLLHIFFSLSNVL